MPQSTAPNPQNSANIALENLPAKVKITEVGLRDGLQNEARSVPVAVKLSLFDRLMAAGVASLETGSFVSPKRVPQMADSGQLMRELTQPKSINHIMLVPNEQGLDALFSLPLDRRPQEILIFGAASEHFSQRNINCSIAESLLRFAPVVERARGAGLRVKGSISCAVGCPYEGPIAAKAVGEVAARMLDIGVQSISVADTIGVGNPSSVAAAFSAVRAHFSLDAVSGHFHDTWGQALINVYAALRLGVWQFDASVSGLGGCPFAPGAGGNVATEDVVYLLQGLGIETGIDLDKLVDAGDFIRNYLQSNNASRTAQAVIAQRRRQETHQAPRQEPRQIL